MIRSKPEQFTRDEWGFVIDFMGHSNCCRFWSVLSDKSVITQTKIPINIVIWLPNNVNLLGVLLFFLYSHYNTKLFFKTGSTGNDKLKHLIDWINSKSDFLNLQNFIKRNLVLVEAEKSSEINKDISQLADVKIIFGSDATCSAIKSYPTKISCKEFYFANKRSILAVLSSELEDLDIGKWFKIATLFGRHGCTSPCDLYVIIDKPVNLRQKLENINLEDNKELFNETLYNEIIVTKQVSNYYNSNFVEIGQVKYPIIQFPDDENKNLLTTSPFILTFQEISEENFFNMEDPNIQTIASFGKSKQFIVSKIKNFKYLPSRIVEIEHSHYLDPVWDGLNWWADSFKCVYTT